jgi:hypothetical protein
LFSHTNRTPKSKSNTTAQTDAVFKPASKKDIPEFNTRLYREREEREWEIRIEKQRRARLERDAAIPPPKQQRNKQRGRPSKQRIPEVV